MSHKLLSLPLLLILPSAAVIAADPIAIYARAGFSYQAADDYHGGENSFAESVFENSEGEYEFLNYTIDAAFGHASGFYLGTGIYASGAEVNTNGLGLGIPDTDSSFEPREIPLALGWEGPAGPVVLRFEGRYIFNIDGDFDEPFATALDRAVILPVTDGSDSFLLSLRAKVDAFGFEHVGTIGYRFYEEDVTHPIFPSFTLGDEFLVDYEIGYVSGPWRFFAGHLASFSGETEGTPSPITGTAYLTEQPWFLEIRGGLQYAVNQRAFLDAGAKYYYEGNDVPQQRTFFVGGTFVY